MTAVHANTDAFDGFSWHDNQVHGLRWELGERARVGDHRWWISDLAEFRADYPRWQVQRGIEATLREIHDANVDRWAALRA